MINLIKNELKKIFSQKKIYVFMVLYLLFNVCIVVLSKTLQQSGTYTGQTFPLQSLGIHLELLTPILMAILAVDLVATEIQDGTINLFLTRPVSRIKLICAKVIALFITILALMLFNMIISYIASSIAFGWGSGFKIDIYNLSALEGIRVTVTAYLISALPQTGFAMLVLFISMLVKDNGTTLGISVAVLFFFSILANITQIQTYLINSYFGIYKVLLVGTTNSIAMKSFGIIGLYIIVFFTAAALLFRQKDIQ